MIWSYGVTTVPGRVYLPSTLASLAAAGFGAPRIFEDNGLRVFGRWVLALWELYIREPCAHRYAVFQDDFEMCLGVREYLERWYPKDGYLNLYTFPENEVLATGLGWYPAKPTTGRGAVALVFDREAVQTVLMSPAVVLKPADAARGWRCVDGAVVTAMEMVGKREYVHNPSLVQHTGDVSAMGNRPHAKSHTFRPGWDAREMIRG